MNSIPARHDTHQIIEHKIPSIYDGIKLMKIKYIKARMNNEVAQISSASKSLYFKKKAVNV